MVTKNEQRTIKLIYSTPDVSLRRIVAELDLGGVASASYIINALQKKGYLKKVGTATSKKYQLTQQALALCEIVDTGSKYSIIPEAVSTFSAITSPIENRSTGSGKIEEFSKYSPREFANGADGVDSTGDNLRKIVSASFTKILNSPIGLQRYGDVIVIAVISVAVVLPACHFFLGDQWLTGFIPIELLLLVLIILNKK